MTLDGPAPPRQYRFVPYGGGVEVLDRFGIRDRIRSGDIAPATELALVGTDDWRAASSYTELARYFELATARPSPQFVQPAKIRDVRPMSERVVYGIVYPIAGGQAVTVLLLAVFSVFPIISILATLATIGVTLDVIRKSADGKTKMPAVVDTGDIGRMMWLYLRVVFVTVVALLPLIVFIPYAIFAVFVGKITAAIALLVILALLAFAAVYYPACLATIAVWDNAIAALNPLYVFTVIKKTGADYFVAVGMWFVATAVTVILKLPQISPFARLPIVGSVFAAFLSLWVLFYASHLLGYAIYRHAPELGWE